MPGKNSYIIAYLNKLQEQNPQQRERLRTLGGGNEILGFYMYYMSASPFSNLYPGGGNIKVSRIFENLYDLMHGEIETTDTVKLQILQQEAAKMLRKTNSLSLVEQYQFEQNLVKAADKIISLDPNSYVKGSEEKYDRDPLPIEQQVLEENRLNVYSRGGQRSLDVENVKTAYKAIQHLERQLVETLGFFTRDSKAFKSLTALATADLNNKKEKSVAEMQYHIETVTKLAQEYSSLYTTPEQKTKNPRRERRLCLADKIGQVGLACLENRDPVDSLEDLTEANETAAAEIWYESFVSELNKKGINFNNRLSLGLVKEIPDFDYDDLSRRIIMPGGMRVRKAQIDQCVDALHEVDDLFSNHVFMKKGKEGSYKGDNLLEHLHTNMRDPNSLSRKEKLRLFKLAKENKLCLELPNTGKDDNFLTTMIQADPLNGCKIGNPPKGIRMVNSDNEFTPQEREQIKKAGFSVKGFADAQKRLSQINTLQESRNTSVQSFMNINILSQQEAGALSREFSWGNVEHPMLTDVVHHPEWFKTKEDRDIQNEIYKIGGLNKAFRTEDEQRTFLERRFGGETLYLLEQNLRKKFGVNKNSQIPFNKIKNEAGQPYGDKYSYQTFNAFCGDAYNGNPVVLDNVKYVLNSGDGKLYKQAPHAKLTGMLYDMIGKKKNAIEQFNHKDLTTAMQKSIRENNNLVKHGYGTSYSCIENNLLTELARNCETVKNELSQKQNLTENEKAVLAFANDIAEFKNLVHEEADISAFAKFDKDKQIENAVNISQ